jgi:glyoxylase-like metal-dependent hydrolase (beta-lactamase superfamily II)
LVGDALFTGDTIFMPDMGTARCDFPGGSVHDLYASVQKLYELPDTTRVFVGHDYQPGGRKVAYESTIGEEKANNKQLKFDTPRDQFEQWRKERDETLGMPRLIIPSLQVNLRNGEMPPKESNGHVYLKVPINVLGGPKS